MRVLVTGADGFIGHHVMRRLHDDDPDHRSLRAFKGDVRDPQAWRTLNDLDVDVVVHLAARVGTGESMYRVVDYTSTNVLGTAVMLEALADSPVRKIVLASSSAVYGPSDDLLTEWHPTEPRSVYGITKLAQEQMVLRWAEATGRQAAALRLFCVYGPGQALDNPYSGLVGIMASRLLAREQPQVFEDGYQTRDLIHVYDVAAAIATACFDPRITGPLNVASGDATTLRDLLAFLREHLGGPEPEYLSERRAGDMRHAVADVTKARSLGLTNAMDLQRGLWEFCKWAQAHKPPEGIQRKAVDELRERGLVA